MNILTRIFAVLFLSVTALSARADLFAFNFAGNGQSASGTLNANATGTAGQFLITSISGTLTGVGIAGLLQQGMFGGNDNLLMMSGNNYLPDGNGFSFVLTDTVQVNVFTFMGPPFDGQQFLARSDGTLAQMTTFQISPVAVPEPSSWMLLGTGVAGAAGVLRRRMVAAF